MRARRARRARPRRGGVRERQRETDGLGPDREAGRGREGETSFLAQCLAVLGDSETLSVCTESLTGSVQKPLHADPLGLHRGPPIPTLSICSGSPTGSERGRGQSE